MELDLVTSITFLQIFPLIRRNLVYVFNKKAVFFSVFTSIFSLLTFSVVIQKCIDFLFKLPFNFCIFYVIIFRPGHFK